MEKIKNISLYSVLRVISGICGLFFFKSSPNLNFFSPPGPYHLPIANVGILESVWFLTLVKIIFLISIALFILGIRIKLFGISAALSKIILLVAFPEGVLAFTYLIPLIWLAFSFAEANDAPSGAQANSPFIYLIASIYLGAALHKLFHFDQMLIRLPIDIMKFARPEFSSLCNNGKCFATTFASYFVVPVELLIGAAFLVPRLRKFGQISNGIFLVTLYAFLELRLVGLLVFIVQAADYTFENRMRIKDFFTDIVLPHKVVLSIGLICLLTLFVFANSDVLILIRELFLNIILFSPFLLLAFRPSLRKKINDLYFLSRTHVAFLLIVISFALLPAVEGYKNTNMLGWSMFSGAYMKNLRLTVTVYDNGCIHLPNYSPLVITQLKPGKVIMSSFSPDLLNRLSNKISLQCPNAKITRD